MMEPVRSESALVRTGKRAGAGAAVAVVAVIAAFALFKLLLAAAIAIGAVLVIGGLLWAVFIRER